MFRSVSYYICFTKNSKNLDNIAKTYRPISVCGGGAKLLSLEEAQDKYKQVGPAELPKYHTVIEIPELSKKKKSKEKEKDKKSSSLASSATPPANIQIQQQFESLQQQSSQLTTSASSHSISSASTAPINIPSNTASSNPTNTTNSGSSSPAFKSLLRNLRVGSIKHQTPPMLDSISSPASKNLNLTPQLDSNSSTFLSNSTVLMRTASTSTFKPSSSTLGVTSPPNNANSEAKIDYSSCISQLQSVASQAINHSSTAMNLSSFTGTLSPPASQSQFSANPSSQTAPILLRSNKLNQSQHSIHSNIVHMGQNQPVMSTFKDIGSPSANLDKKCKWFRLYLIAS